MDCPHCGRPVILDLKQAELRKTATAAMQKPADFPVGVVKSLADAVENKVRQGPLSNLARFANQDFGEKKTEGLAAGWGSSTKELMKRREDLFKQGYRVPTTKDEIENMSKEQKAGALQALIMRSLGSKKAE